MADCLSCLGTGEVPTKWDAVHIDTGDGRPGSYYVGQEPVAFDWCTCDKGQKLKGLEAEREAQEAAYIEAWAEQSNEAEKAGF